MQTRQYGRHVEIVCIVVVVSDGWIVDVIVSISRLGRVVSLTVHMVS